MVFYLAAGVQYIEGNRYGVMILDIGPNEEIRERAIKEIKEMGVSIEKTTKGEEEDL